MEEVKEILRIARDLLALSEPPKPSNVNDAAWDRWKEELWPDIEKDISRSRVKLKGFNKNDAFNEYFQLSYKGIDFSVGLSKLSGKSGVKELESFLRNIDDAVQVAENLYKGRSSIGDIFYSDIHTRVKDVFKSKSSRDIAYSFVVDYLRKKGMRVMS